MHRSPLVWTLRAVLAAGLAAAPAGAQTPRLVLRTGDALSSGLAPDLEIVGSGPRDTVTLVAWRRVLRFVSPTRADTVTVRSFADFAGVRAGPIRVGRATPIRGTWSGPDALAPFWSMVRHDTTLSLPTGRALLQLVRRGRVVDSLVMTLGGAAPGVTERWVSGAGFAGAFAAPASPGPHPALLLLHGSEGGDSARARQLAEAFADNGFAALAVTYFAWSGAVPGVPGALVNIPLETLDRARDWLGSQAGVDTSRTGIWGGSKGAEFALVAAARRSWPRAVVACVPSDVVWSGFGRELAPGERLSSWSDGGRSLPYVPYDRYEEALAGRVTGRTVHDRSRRVFADSVPAARIPIEASRARFLLLGSDRDELWGSGDATRALAARMKAARRDRQVTALVRPLSGHGMCGTGVAPQAAFERAYPTDAPPDARATAQAAAENWRETLRFLRAALRP